MSSATLILPNQLFKNHPLIHKSDAIFLFEDQLFFQDVQYPHQFHKKKLVLHRASMKAYEQWLSKKFRKVAYINYEQSKNLKNLKDYCEEQHIEQINIAEINDSILKKRLNTFTQSNNIQLTIFPSPGFLNSVEYNVRFFKQKKHFYHNYFYIDQRKKHDILINNDEPAGGKWSFDQENRKPMDSSNTIPTIPMIKTGNHLKEAITYVENNFSPNPGQLTGFFYPYTFDQADHWMNDFFIHRFNNFGSYQDAISKKEPFLYHSLLSSSLNIGILTPLQIINNATKYMNTYNIPLNSMEGFIRQIIGWREFMRAVYLLRGNQQRSMNFFKHTYPIPQEFYTAETEIKPVDTVIQRILSTGYAHHIERLMILGNFMLLCEIHPTAVYQWFMDMFIDSYDWVMVPNVYGMSQFADGGLMTSKPYISSSNYILKMSDYSKGKWCPIWDGLFWRFIDKHQDFFKKNPRMRMLVSYWNKMAKNKKKKKINVAESYLSNLHGTKFIKG